MKYLAFLASASILYCSAISAQPLTGVDNLIAHREYKSAYHLLDSLDAKNTNPDLAIKKLDLLLRYYAKSVNHLYFGLVDLSPNGDLAKLRDDKNASYDLIHFDGERVLEKLITTYPRNFQLPLALGNYFYEVYTNFAGSWVESDSEILGSMESYLHLALDNGVRDDNTFSRLGYLALTRSNYAQSAYYYRTAIDSGSDDVTDHYNLAVSELYLDKHQLALPEALYAMRHYDDNIRKADAAQIAGVIFDELHSFDSATYYYTLALRFDSTNSGALKGLMELSLGADNLPMATGYATEFFARNNGQETLNDIVRSFHSTNNDADLIQWFAKTMDAYVTDKENSGGLRLVFAQFYLSINEKNRAAQLLSEARTYFEEVYDKNNDVFGFIDELMQQTR